MANDWRKIVADVIEIQEDAEIDSSPGPALQWYPSQWLSDPAVQLMSMAARGVHHHLLMVAWKGFDLDDKAIPCSIPDDADLLKALCQHPQEWELMWPMVRRGWKSSGERLWNLGLCRVYLDQMKRRRSAKRSADARWMRSVSGRNAPGSLGDANASESHAVASNLQCSSSSSSSSSSKEEETQASLPTGDTLRPAIDRVYGRYLELKPSWYRILGKPAPKRTSLTRAGRSAIRSHFVNGRTEDDLLRALGNVQNSAWLMGKITGEARLSVTQVFAKTSKADQVEILLEKTSRDRELNPFSGGGIR